jgi:hypothetical protein
MMSNQSSSFKYVLWVEKEPLCKSFIRKIKPDYSIEIIDTNDDLNIGDGYFYDLNYGDLLLCAKNTLNHKNLIDDTLEEISKKVMANAGYDAKRDDDNIEIAKDISNLYIKYTKLHNELNVLVFWSAIADLLSEDIKLDGHFSYELSLLFDDKSIVNGVITASEMKNNLVKYDLFKNIDVNITYDNKHETEEYAFPNGYNLIAFEVRNFLKQEKDVKICENCGKLFIPSVRSDEKYCDFIFKNGKTCKELAFTFKLDNDEALREYRKIYKTQNARKQRNRQIPAISERFDLWASNAKKVLAQCQKGEITIEDMKMKISSSNWMQAGGEIDG